jgi:Ca-activated chloride channel homolog
MKRVVLFLAVLAGRASAQGFLLERGIEGPSPHLRAVSERVNIAIDHQYATTVLEQQFENVTDERLEGRYVLRTAGAGVEGFAYWNGEEKIVGEVFEKNAARRVYDDVVGRRRDPGLVEQTGEGSFAFNVFPIEPHERKRIEVRLGQRLSRAGNLIEYRLTLSGGQNDVSLDIRDPHPIAKVDSSSHALTVAGAGTSHVRVNASGTDAGARDLVIAIELAALPWQPSAVVHRDPGQDAYLVLQMAAPDRLDQSQVSSKDVTVVIDRSGSMTGAPLEQACAAAELVVRRLRRGDRVNVIAFDHRVDPLFAKPEPVEAARDTALQFIRGIAARGGTDIAGALAAALQSQNGGHEPHIVLFLTDGQSNSEAALRVAAGDPGDARVFTIGLGAGVQKPLLSRLASMKRGRFTYVESAEALELRIGHLFDQIESPALVGVTVEARGATFSRTYPRTLPDLSAGDDLLLTGRVTGAPGATLQLIVHGMLSGRQVDYPVSVTVPESESHPWAGRLWAKSRIDDVLEEMALTRSPRPEQSNEVIELGLAYNLVTPYTSFLAVPESELNGAQAAELTSLREQRARAIAAHRDAAALSRTRMPPGDPVLTVSAPKDAVQVTAYFPFGLVRDLTWDAKLDRWVLRFLVPVDVPDGDYEATVVIVKRNGTVELAKARYTIDSTDPEFEVEAKNVDGLVFVHVTSSEPARRVTAALVANPKRRVELTGDGSQFAGVLRGSGPVRVVVADEARNESMREVVPR